jgi:carbonic anhydrase
MAYSGYSVLFAMVLLSTNAQTVWNYVEEGSDWTDSSCVNGREQSPLDIDNDYVQEAREEFGR